MPDKDMTQPTQLNLNKLCDKMRQAGYSDYMISQAVELVNELQQMGVQGLDKFVRKLSYNLGNKDNGEDYYASYSDFRKEGLFARILGRNAFKQIEIEYTNKGPDVKARYNRRTVCFEITRKRENKEDKRISIEGGGFIKPYKTNNVISTIQDKIRQLESDELNIMVLWIDTKSINRMIVTQAIADLQQEIDRNPATYKKLSGVLFTTGINTSTLKQFTLHKNDKANKPLPNRLAAKLEIMIEENPKELRRRYTKQAAVLRDELLAAPRKRRL